MFVELVLRIVSKLGLEPAALIGAAALLFPLIGTQPVFAQFIRKHEASELRGFHYNGAVKRIVRSFQSDSQARQEFERILSAVGLNWISDRVELRASGDVGNAAAGIGADGKRFIFYNAEFMQKLRQRTAEHWSLVSILAHEVGHHLAFHTEVNGRWHEFELEADYFSGFVLRRLGAKLAQASAAMRTISPKDATDTHPGLKDRIQAITIGWTDGGGAGPPRGLKDPEAAAGAVVTSNRPAPTVARQQEQPASGEGDALTSADPETRMLAVLATRNASRINQEIKGFLAANRSEIRGIGLKAYFVRNRRFTVMFELPDWLQKEVEQAQRTGNWRDVKAGSLVKMHADTGGELVFEHDLADIGEEKTTGWSMAQRRDKFYSGEIKFTRVGMRFRMRLAVGPRAICSFRFTLSEGRLKGPASCNRMSGYPPFAPFSAEVRLD